jgi:hypothetical protein
MLQVVVTLIRATRYILDSLIAKALGLITSRNIPDKETSVTKGRALILIGSIGIK